MSLTIVQHLSPFVPSLPDIDNGLAYSRRNGMGPIPTYPRDEQFHLPPQVKANMDKARVLRHLLDQLTPVEEAAIRQITPLIHLTRLTHGNLGTKGNTSCVWQQSKLHLLLPHLPRDIKYIFIVRGNSRSRSGLKSTRVRRKFIQQALEMLRSCDADNVWTHVTIVRERLDAWPEDGDLASLNDAVCVQKVDENGEIIIDTENGPDPNPTSNTTQNASGNLDGPTTLQNDVHIEETFEGLTDVTNISVANVANANQTITAVQDMADHLRHHDPNDPTPTYNNDRTEVTFRQPEVLSTHGFADMTKTPFAWARTFPTLFPPSYILLNGAWKWVILGDITGWYRIRENSPFMSVASGSYGGLTGGPSNIQPSSTSS